MPIEISAPLHFQTLVSSTKYVFADFYATWCPPCKTISPVYEQLSKAHSVPSELQFVKVNVDEQGEVAAKYGITAMPTFLVFKDGKVIETIRGANPPALKNAVQKASAEVKSALATKASEPKGGDKDSVAEGEEQKTVSGSYGMTGGNNWKMSLN